MTVVPNRWCQTASVRSNDLTRGVRHQCQTKKMLKFVGMCDIKRNSDEKDVEFRRNV